MNHEDIARLKADYQAKLDTETLLIDRTESAEKALQKAEYERNLQFAAKEAQAELRAAVLEAKEDAQQKLNTYIAKIEAKDNEIARLNSEIVALKLRTSKKSYTLERKVISYPRLKKHSINFRVLFYVSRFFIVIFHNHIER